MSKALRLTPADRAALDYLEELKKSIYQATAVDLSESVAQRKKRVAALEADDEAWFKYYFPNYCTAEPAPFHKKATRRVMKHPEWYEVRAWSRELAKSTRTMMEVLKLGLTGKKKNVLVVSNSQDNAIRLLAPYKASLESNQRIINDYGKQVRYGKWTDSEFITLGGVSFRAIGAGQSPRGTRNEAARPDTILIDDLDTDTDCRNPDIITDRWAWVEGALIPARSISVPLLVIFCGNIIAENCCIKKAIEKADHVDIVNIRDAAGQSTWPQKNTEEMIDRALAKISYLAAQGEYFNNPITVGRTFTELNFKKVLPLWQYDGLCCYTDPSWKDTQRNDFKATVLIGRKGAEFHVIRAYVFQTSIAKMIEWHYEIKALVGACPCYFYMEGNFMQDTLIKPFYDEGARRGAVIPIQPDTRDKKQKFARIEAALEPLNRNGKLWFNEDERHSLGMKNLTDQFYALSPTSRAHDDGPDAVEGGVYVLNTKLITEAPIHAVPRRPSNNKNRY